MQPGALSLLYVEDDPSLARSFQHCLQARGWSVEVAPTLGDGRRAAARGRFDAMVIDLQLPDGDGLSLLQELNDAGQLPRVTFVLSGTLDVERAVQAVLMGALDVLEKPIEPGELNEKLRGALASVRGAPAAEEQARQILGASPAMSALRRDIVTLAGYPDLPVMLLGEAGTGKKLVASALHRASRPGEPFVVVDPAAIPEAFIEEELFGSEAGGSSAPRRGLLEAAGRGTLLLDRLQELPACVQPKLLRVLETRSFRRCGGARNLPLRARVISASQRKPGEPDSPLRSDLYYRLAGFVATLPPLRERPEDIDELARHFVAELRDAARAAPLWLNQEALACLRAQEWRGNAAQLRALLREAATSATEVLGIGEIEAALSRMGSAEPSSELQSGTMPVAPRFSLPIRDLERRMIVDAWTASGNNLSEAARRVGLPRTTLRDKLKRFGLR